MSKEKLLTGGVSFDSAVQQPEQDNNPNRTTTPTGQQPQQDNNPNRTTTPTGQQPRQDKNSNRTTTPTGQQPQQDGLHELNFFRSL
jgi:hypothetical protein